MSHSTLDVASREDDSPNELMQATHNFHVRTRICVEVGGRHFNPLQPNDTYKRLTAPLASKRYILYIYSTNIGPEFFKYGIYSPLFPLQNAVCFIILTYLVPVLQTFYI